MINYRVHIYKITR